MHQCIAKFSVRLIAVTSLMMSTGSVIAAQPSIEQVNDALDIAEITARNGMLALSAKAISRSLEYGPPTVLRTPTKPEFLPNVVRAETLSTVSKTPQEAIMERIPRTIFSLSNVWRDQADPAMIYVALRDVVLPPQRSAEVYLYHVPLKVEPLQPDRLPPSQSVAQELVFWAAKANRIEDLIEHLTARSSSESVERALLLLMSAIELNDEAVVRRQSLFLFERMANGSTRPSAELVAFVGMSFLRNGQYPKLAAMLLEVAAKTLTGIDQLDPQIDSPTRAILLAAARSRFALGENESAIGLLKNYLEIQVRGKYGIASKGLTSRKEEVVGRELFRRGLVNEASVLLGPEVVARFRRRYRIPNLAGDADARSSTDVPQKGQRVLNIISGTETTATDSENQIWFCTWDADSQKSEILFSLPDFLNASAVSVSPDGHEVAFAATFPGEAVTSDSQLYIASIDGKQIRCLGRGTLPSWSPQGKRLAFSSYSPNRGVWIMRSDGSDRILIDETGWGARWSPNGRMIAYTKLIDRRWEFVIYDMVEDEFFPLFRNVGTAFTNIFGGFEWSIDSSHIAFKATTDRGASNNTDYIITTTNVFGPLDLESVYRHRGYISGELAWGRTIDSPLVTAIKNTFAASEQLVRIGPDSTSAAKPLIGQMAGRRNGSVSWMPDGRVMVYISKPRKR